ncbi:hypothetical protein G9A89_003647 [Geosiphon pyriformis]|nr:hypothetical protein G9A89_003647 [Geosiphon pyriformis]
MQKSGWRKDINFTTLSKVSHSEAGHSDSMPNSEETIKELAQYILHNNFSIKDVKAETHNLAKSVPNANVTSSRLSRFRRELQNLSALSDIIEATRFPNIMKNPMKFREISEEKLKNLRESIIWTISH